MPGHLLSVRDLKVWFPVRLGVVGALRGKEQKNVRAVDGIDFEVNQGEVYCLVGESGCGKTTTGKAILRLNEATTGNILYRVPEEEMERLEEVEARLASLGPSLAQASDRGDGNVPAEYREVHRLKASALEALYPWKSVSLQLRREKLERTVAFLEDRIRALKDGTDPAVVRMISREQERLKLLRTLGPGYTPKRQRKITQLRREVKDAGYAVRRAEATHIGVRKARRRQTRLERKLTNLEAEAKQGGIASSKDIGIQEQSLEQRAKHLTEIELGATTEELLRARNDLGNLLTQQSQALARASQVLPEIEQSLVHLRAQGGPALEALELQALREDIIRRHDLSQWSPEQTTELRKHMQIIYQDPYESLNPKMSIFDIVAEPLLANKIVDTPAQAEIVVRKALEDVGLKPAEEYMFRYPHELSGGQRQRVGIATALVVGPDFIMADEPVSMLDASVRTEILALLLDLKKRKNLTYLFITHDLGLAWIIADKIAVMYLGKIVEQGDGPVVIREPQHPYTRSLISVVPSPNPEIQREKIILKGERPNPVDIPPGCRFHPRCPNAVGICGWDATEVQEDVTRLLREDADGFSEAGTARGTAVANPLELVVETPSPEAFASYLRKRIQAVALGRPALGAIREMRPDGSKLHLVLVEPMEPQLHPTPNGALVACHIVGQVAG